MEKLVPPATKDTLELIGSIAWHGGTVAESRPPKNLPDRIGPHIPRRQTRKPQAGPPLHGLFGLGSAPAIRNVRFGTNLPIVSFESKGRFTLRKVAKILTDRLKTAHSPHSRPRMMVPPVRLDMRVLAPASVLPVARLSKLASDGGTRLWVDHSISRRSSQGRAGRDDVRRCAHPCGSGQVGYHMRSSSRFRCRRTSSSTRFAVGWST